ncbi:hypothetical protein [Agrilutibacter solisilvae]|uniref:Serine-threonine protein kinase n=1 Tax=Agrilutibacter solisilvae TaxID=2763317 RepID=A0A974XW07_9GAMM|nr:hypothetical protein [Lysobacter solisilvae]QSX76932.1 hypothetical protein I8J32_008840 [Lysobacter solisilvae]
MPKMIPVGPYQTRQTAEGLSFPYYIIPFDKDGRCEGPATREHLLNAAAGKNFTDIFLFSHGWNNDWETATKRYSDFIDGYVGQRTTLGLPKKDGYKPLLVGVFWPSQALAWFDSETGPGFAGAGDPATAAPEVDDGRALAGDIAQSLPADQRDAFYDLVQRPALTQAEGRELAAMLASVLAPDDEGLERGAPSADDLLAAANQMGAPPDFDTVGGGGAAAAGPDAAGFGDLVAKLDPRNLIKPFTVWQMKDRAGVVGSRGVSKLLGDLLGKSEARVHLLGHSFGCKVVMSATAALPAPPRKVHSALLLQPAISQYAFSSKVPESGLAGGFHGNLQRIDRPVLATFSGNDVALSKTFHLAVRRKSDLGEQPAAAGQSPSIYGALGGFGPQEADAVVVRIKPAGEAYDFGAGGRLVGVEGTGTITGHGDISKPATWWLAYSIATG